MTTIDTRSPAATELVRAVAGAPPGNVRRARLRARAIEAWLPLAHRLARRYAGERDDMDDLCQTATVGLIKAVDGFDPRAGDDFAAYAIPTIAGELKRYFRDRCWTIRPPRRLHNLYLRIRDARSRIAQERGHSPTVAEMARELDVTVDEVLEALECGYVRRAGSLSTRIGPDSSTELGDVLPAPDDQYRAAELHLDLSAALARLDTREQQIIALYFYGNRSQAEIGRRLGVSQMHISRLLQRALAALRDEMAPGPVSPARRSAAESAGTSTPTDVHR